MQDPATSGTKARIEACLGQASGKQTRSRCEEKRGNVHRMRILIYLCCCNISEHVPSTVIIHWHCIHWFVWGCGSAGQLQVKLAPAAGWRWGGCAVLTVVVDLNCAWLCADNNYLCDLDLIQRPCSYSNPDSFHRSSHSTRRHLATRDRLATLDRRWILLSHPSHTTPDSTTSLRNIYTLSAQALKHFGVLS